MTRDRTFILLFLIMLVIAAGNTALQSVLPALGRLLGVPDSAVAAAFSAEASLEMTTEPTSNLAVSPLPLRSASIASRLVSSPFNGGAVFPSRSRDDA